TARPQGAERTNFRALRFDSERDHLLFAQFCVLWFPLGTVAGRWTTHELLDLSPVHGAVGFRRLAVASIGTADRVRRFAVAIAGDVRRADTGRTSRSRSPCCGRDWQPVLVTAGFRGQILNSVS